MDSDAMSRLKGLDQKYPKVAELIPGIKHKASQ